MKIQKGVQKDKTGYSVLKDGECLGFVYKEVGIGSVEMWKHDKDGFEFGTRKRAIDDLVTRFSKKEIPKVRVNAVLSYLNGLMKLEGSNVRFYMEDRSGRPVICIGIVEDKYIERTDLKVTEEFYVTLNHALESILGEAVVTFDNYRQSFWSERIVL